MLCRQNALKIAETNKFVTPPMEANGLQMVVRLYPLTHNLCSHTPARRMDSKPVVLFNEHIIVTDAVAKDRKQAEGGESCG